LQIQQIAKAVCIVGYRGLITVKTGLWAKPVTCSVVLITFFPSCHWDRLGR